VSLLVEPNGPAIEIRTDSEYISKLRSEQYNFVEKAPEVQIVRPDNDCGRSILVQWYDTFSL
jgi:hypothetical protein